MTPSGKTEEELIKLSNGLNQEMRYAINKCLSKNDLVGKEGALNVVFNAIVNTMAAVVERAQMDEGEVDLVAEVVKLRLFDAYLRRREKEKAEKTQ